MPAVVYARPSSVRLSPFRRELSHLSSMMHPGSLRINRNLMMDTVGPIAKNPKSLSTHPKNRTTVEVRIYTPAPCQHNGSVRLSIEPLLPCRRNQLTEIKSAKGAFRAYGCFMSRPSEAVHRKSRLTTLSTQ